MLCRAWMVVCCFGLCACLGPTMTVWTSRLPNYMPNRRLRLCLGLSGMLSNSSTTLLGGVTYLRVWSPHTVCLEISMPIDNLHLSRSTLTTRDIYLLYRHLIIFRPWCSKLYNSISSIPDTCGLSSFTILLLFPPSTDRLLLLTTSQFLCIIDVSARRRCSPLNFLYLCCWH